MEQDLGWGQEIGVGSCQAPLSGAGDLGNPTTALRASVYSVVVQKAALPLGVVRTHDGPNLHVLLAVDSGEG